MKISQLLGAIILAASVAINPASAGGAAPSHDPASPSQRLANSVPDLRLRALLGEVLDRNHEIAAAAARAAAERYRAVQQGVLPDPRAEITAYLQPPETRVGPQRASFKISQTLPGAGKRGLRERAALHNATALEAEIEVLRLRLLTDTRRAYHEIAYLDAAREIVVSDRLILAHFEELARARYASGSGLQQEVVSIQAEITRLDGRLSELAERRAATVASLNSLRDRPGESVPPISPPRASYLAVDWQESRDRAIASRPEVVALTARVDRAEAAAELARKAGGPDFNVGLMYAYVDRRDDADPRGNGQDVLGVSGGITLPVWRSGVEAAVEEAAQMRLVAEARLRAAVTEINRELGELRGQLPEVSRRQELFEGILKTQSEQALRSAEAAYASGRVDAVALLDAERTLLDVRLSAERSRADRAIVLARLEAAIAAPLPKILETTGGAS